MLRRVQRAVCAALLPALILAGCSSIPELDETAEPPANLPAADSVQAAGGGEASVTTRPLQAQDTVVLGPVQSTLLIGPSGTGDAEEPDPEGGETSSAPGPPTTEDPDSEDPDSEQPDSEDPDSEDPDSPPLAALTRERTDEIISLLAGAVGATENVSDSIKAVTLFPGGIPTPPDAVITEVSVTVRVDPIDPTGSVVAESRVNLTSSLTAADAVRLMQGGLGATGLIADRVSEGELFSGEPFTSFSFVPQGAELSEGLTVLVVDPETKTGTTSSLVQITNVSFSRDTSLLSIYADWAGEPSVLPEIGRLSAVSVSLQSGVFIGRPNQLFTGTITRFEPFGSFDDAVEEIGETFDAPLDNTESPLLADVSLFADGESGLLVLTEITDDERPGVSLGLQFQTDVDTEAARAENEDPDAVAEDPDAEAQDP